MRSFLIATVLQGVPYGALLLGVTLVAAILWAFLGRKHAVGSRRVFGLCALALILGPLAGAGLAGLRIAFGDVVPLDRRPFVSALTVLGAVAGVIAAVLTAIVGAIKARRRGR